MEACANRSTANIKIDRSPSAISNACPCNLSSGAWCSGITSAPHAEGPGFKSQCVHLSSSTNFDLPRALLRHARFQHSTAWPFGWLCALARLLGKASAPDIHSPCATERSRKSPHRLVARTSRRGRDNPGSTPGEDIFSSGSIPMRSVISQNTTTLKQLSSTRGLPGQRSCQLQHSAADLRLRRLPPPLPFCSKCWLPTPWRAAST